MIVISIFYNFGAEWTEEERVLQSGLWRNNWIIPSECPSLQRLHNLKRDPSCLSTMPPVPTRHNFGLIKKMYSPFWNKSYYSFFKNISPLKFLNFILRRGFLKLKGLGPLYLGQEWVERISPGRILSKEICEREGGTSSLQMTPAQSEFCAEMGLLKGPTWVSWGSCRLGETQALKWAASQLRQQRLVSMLVRT